MKSLSKTLRLTDANKNYGKNRTARTKGHTFFTKVHGASLRQVVKSMPWEVSENWFSMIFTRKTQLEKFRKSVRKVLSEKNS